MVFGWRMAGLRFQRPDCIADLKPADNSRPDSGGGATNDGRPGRSSSPGGAAGFTILPHVSPFPAANVGTELSGSRHLRHARQLRFVVERLATPDTYTDTAVDLQYERPFGVNLLTLHATYIHEGSHLDGTFAAGGAAAPTQHLNTLRADATYHLRSRYTLTVCRSCPPLAVPIPFYLRPLPSPAVRSGVPTALNSSVRPASGQNRTSTCQSRTPATRRLTARARIMTEQAEMRRPTTPYMSRCG